MDDNGTVLLNTQQMISSDSSCRCLDKGTNYKVQWMNAIGVWLNVDKPGDLAHEPDPAFSVNYSKNFLGDKYPSEFPLEKVRQKDENDTRTMYEYDSDTHECDLSTQTCNFPTLQVYVHKTQV